MKNKVTLFLTVAAFTILSSCSSEDNKNNNRNNDEIAANGCKITKVVYTRFSQNGSQRGNETIDVIYQDNKITSFIVKNDFLNETQTIKVVYNENSDLVKELTPSHASWKYAFTYDNKKQMTQTDFSNSRGSADTYFYQYNGSGELLKENYSFDYGSNETRTGSYTYEWSGGNCIKIDVQSTRFYNGSTYDYTGQNLMEYGNLANNMPKYLCRLLLFVSEEANYYDLFMSKNLITKNSYNDNGDLGTYDYTYTLTDKGLVESIKVLQTYKHPFNGSTIEENSEYTFEYECK